MKALLAASALFLAACGGSVSSPRAPIIKERLQAWGEESFPDDRSTDWLLRGIEDRGDLSVVTAEPSPLRDGAYPKARFVLSFAKPDAPELIACFALDGKSWVQLFEDADAPAGWREKSGLR